MPQRFITPFATIAATLSLTLPTALAEQYIVNGDGSGDFTTIQDAVDYSVSGDEIVVAAGLYVVDSSIDEPRLAVVTVHNKSLRIFSNGGPGVTFIDGQNKVQCVRVSSVEACDVQLQGFTIFRGLSTPQTGDDPPGESYGGGLYLSGNLNATISNCAIRDNVAEASGGGLAAIGVHLTLHQCQLNGNSAPAGTGGGIHAEASFINLSECLLTSNQAPSGGGLMLQQSQATIMASTFHLNEASYSGGGLQAMQSDVHLVDSEFTFNMALIGGASTCESGSSMVLDDCRMANQTQDSGTLAVLLDSQAVLQNCTLEDNTSWFGGAAAVWDDSELLVRTSQLLNNHAEDGGVCALATNGVVTLDSCHIEGNQVTGDGGVVHMVSNSVAILQDCTIRWNSSSHDGGVLAASGAGVASLTGCDMDDNQATVGGVAHITAGGLTMMACTARSNTATIGGTVYLVDASEAELEDCRFELNESSAYGVVHSSTSSLATIAASTFCENTPLDITGPWSDGGDNAFPTHCNCSGDLNGNGSVDVNDLLALIQAWGTPEGDLDGDGETNVSDVLLLLEHWGPCPG